MFHHIASEILAELVNRRVERWAAGGRTPEAARDDDGDRWVMRFGARYRMQAVMTCAVFACFCGGAVVLELIGNPLAFPIRMAYAFFIFPVFVLSAVLAARGCFTTVDLCDTAIRVRFCAVGVKTLEWSRVSSVRYSPVFSLFTIEDFDGRRIRIPARMHGLRTFCDFLIRLEANAIDPSAAIKLVEIR